MISMNDENLEGTPGLAIDDDPAVPGLSLRPERAEERRPVEELTREAFWNRYAPGCTEHFILHRLREAPGFRPWHSIVAEYDGNAIGHALLSPADILLDAGGALPVLTLGPLSVLPACARRGVGAALMRAAIQVAREQGETALLLTGDPAYYGRFGFLPASAFGVRMGALPASGGAPYFMALPLFDGALAGKAGRYRASPLFEEAEGETFSAYDRTFPPRRKLKLPGQLR